LTISLIKKYRNFWI